MDHRWGEATWQDRAERGEQSRFGARRIERDPDVERRDRLREEERRRLLNQSPWSIGVAYYDQRDLYTRNGSIEEDGYGVGPHSHPDVGSYAYHRDYSPGPMDVHTGDASLYEREAWPWLNYKSPDDDPYFGHLHSHEHQDARGSFWHRLKERVARLFHGGGRPAVEVEPRADERIRRDVYRALRECRELDASEIVVGVLSATVKLEGTVVDRRAKRLAAKLSWEVPGVKSVENRLEIRHPDPHDTSFVFGMPFA